MTSPPAAAMGSVDSGCGGIDNALHDRGSARRGRRRASRLRDGPERLPHRRSRRGARRTRPRRHRRRYARAARAGRPAPCQSRDQGAAPRRGLDRGHRGSRRCARCGHAADLSRGRPQPVGRLAGRARPARGAAGASLVRPLAGRTPRFPHPGDDDKRPPARRAPRLCHGPARIRTFLPAAAGAGRAVAHHHDGATQRRPARTPGAECGGGDGA